MWNLSAELDSSCSNRGPSFINSKTLEAICWLGLLMKSLDWEEIKRTLGFLQHMCFLFTPSESTTSGKPWFYLSTYGLRSALSNQKCTIWIVYLHKMGLIDYLGGNFCYKRWLPLSLSGTQFRLLPESICLSAAASLAQTNALNFYYILKHILVDTTKLIICRLSVCREMMVNGQ